MLTLYHAPQSRSSRIIWLLEELGADYALQITNISRQDGSGAADAANPHPYKKVPALVHDGELITESIAIFAYLTDLFPGPHLAPLAGEAKRGAYLSWLAYYAGVIEPIVHFKFMGIDGDPFLSRTFRTGEQMYETINSALDHQPFMLGDAFSAIDVLYASLGMFIRDALPPGDRIDAYLKTCSQRPALARAQAKDSGTLEVRT